MREILDERLKLPRAEAARRMKISRPSLYAILDRRAAVTANMAVRFGALTGAAPELYLRMQANYDLWRARQTLEDTLAQIRPA
jgi:antitoxin HigA-1